MTDEDPSKIQTQVLFLQAILPPFHIALFIFFPSVRFQLGELLSFSTLLPVVSCMHFCLLKHGKDLQKIKDLTISVYYY